MGSIKRVDGKDITGFGNAGHDILNENPSGIYRMIIDFFYQICTGYIRDAGIIFNNTTQYSDFQDQMKERTSVLKM